MKLNRSALAAGLVAGAATVVACSGQTSPTGNASGGNSNGIGQTGSNGGNVGNVSVGLTIFTPGGVQENLTSVDWTISGGPGGPYTGVDDIGNAQSVEWVAGGILAGNGYTLSVTGTDSLGDACTGASTSFGVTAGQTTDVALLITCTIPTDGAIAADVRTGSVAVDASVAVVQQGAYSCPGIGSFAVMPAEVSGSQTAGLSISTINGTGSTIAWSATSSCTTGSITGFVGADGGLNDTTDPNVSFSCGTCVGTAVVTAQVQLDVVPLGADASTNVCNGALYTSMSGNVTCEGGGTVQCPSGEQVCADGGPCVALNGSPVDPNNCGACGVTCTGGTVCTHSSSTGVNSCVTPPATACTTAPCASSGPNSVECTGNTNDVCTTTEAQFVDFDVNAGHLTSAGQLTPTSCYECMLNIGCLDDNEFGDTGHECTDVATPAVDGESALQSCVDNVECMLQTSPACANSDPPSQCLCGTNNGAACLNAGAANGPCLTQELNGLPGVGTTCSSPGALPDGGVGEPASCTEGNPTSIQEAFTNTALPAGMANTLLGCAEANCASQCSL